MGHGEVSVMHINKISLGQEYIRRYNCAEKVNPL